MIDRLNKKLPGGVGDTSSTSSVNPVQLSLGVQIEMEHTNDPEIAKEIAMDHLTEDPQYYTKLVKAGLAKEFGPSATSGLGDPDQSFNDEARVGKKGLTNGNMHGTIGGTSDGKVHGRNSDPIVNKTIDIELEEKKGKKRPKPTNPSLWARAKAAARSKFDVYPSAYANGWAARWYKSKGGGWRMSEDTTPNESVVGQVFDGPSPAETSPEGTGTFGSGYDFVGYAENTNKTMKKEELKRILKTLIRESMQEIEQDVTADTVDTAVTPSDAGDDTEGDETDGGEVKTQNIVLNLDRETAQKLHDMLMAQLATSNDTEGGEPQPVAQDMDSDQLPVADEEGSEGQGDIGEITFEQSKEIDETKKKWIQNAIKPAKKGALHKQLGVPQGQKIPADKLAAAAKKGGKVGQRARLAMTLKKLKKK